LFLQFAAATRRALDRRFLAHEQLEVMMARLALVFVQGHAYKDKPAKGAALDITG
jgi:hypothetical protein